jgi:hypothetical protein
MHATAEERAPVLDLLGAAGPDLIAQIDPTDPADAVALSMPTDLEKAVPAERAFAPASGFAEPVLGPAAALSRRYPKPAGTGKAVALDEMPAPMAFAEEQMEREKTAGPEAWLDSVDSELAAEGQVGCTGGPGKNYQEFQETVGIGMAVAL